MSTSINLGTLAVTGVGPFTDTVQWGDGQTSTFSPSGSGPLSLAHTYATAGTYTIGETVSEYDGGSTTASFSINVTSPSTSTTLTSSAASAVYGQIVTFTATVAGPGAPTGTVAFYAGAVNTADQIGTGTLSVVDGQDVATFSTHVAGRQRQSVRDHGGLRRRCRQHGQHLERRQPDDQSPTPRPRRPSSSATTSDFGQALTLTASVTANAPGSGSPTGSVDFYDTTTPTDLGSVPLVGGAASLPIATLPVGTQTITETYSGDANFITSNGTVSQTSSSPSTSSTPPTSAPHSPGALSFRQPSIDIPGQMIVDSPAKPAVTVTGTAKIIASYNGVVGTVSEPGTASISPEPVTGIKAVADPLAGLAVPSLTGPAVSVNLTPAPRRSARASTARSRSRAPPA